MPKDEFDVRLAQWKFSLISIVAQIVDISRAAFQAGHAGSIPVTRSSDVLTQTGASKDPGLLNSDLGDRARAPHKRTR